MSTSTRLYKANPIVDRFDRWSWKNVSEQTFWRYSDWHSYPMREILREDTEFHVAPRDESYAWSIGFKLETMVAGTPIMFQGYTGNIILKFNFRYFIDVGPDDSWPVLAAVVIAGKFYDSDSGLFSLGIPAGPGDWGSFYLEIPPIDLFTGTGLHSSDMRASVGIQRWPGTFGHYVIERFEIANFELWNGAQLFTSGGPPLYPNQLPPEPGGDIDSGPSVGLQHRRVNVTPSGGPTGAETLIHIHRGFHSQSERISARFSAVPLHAVGGHAAHWSDSWYDRPLPT